nr:uncharacterized protein LOC127335317 [Lolium perenne]
MEAHYGKKEEEKAAAKAAKKADREERRVKSAARKKEREEKAAERARSISRDQDLMVEKERLEKEAKLELISLTQAHEEEDRDYALGWVDEIKTKKRYLEESHGWLLEDVATLTKNFKSLERKFELLSEMRRHPQEEVYKKKEDEGPNSCCDKLLDEVCFLRRHNARFLEVISTQEEALDEYYRLSKEKVPCCDHEEEIATLKRHKAKLKEVNDMQNEFLMEWVRLRKENVTCCNHEDEYASLKRSKANLMVIKSMQDESLKEYHLSSKDHISFNHEDDIATLEGHKRLLLKRNSLLEEALSEQFRVNKEKEVQVFDITHPHPDHEDEVNRLKSKIESLQIQAQFLEGVIEARVDANEESCNEGEVAMKPKKKRGRRIKIKRNIIIGPIEKWVPISKS